MADEQKVIDAAAGEVDDLRDIIDKQDRNIAELRAAIQVLSDERTAEIDVRSQLQIDLANLRGEIEGNTNGLEEFATLEPHLETLRYGDQSPRTGGTSAIAKLSVGSAVNSGPIGFTVEEESDPTVLNADLDNNQITVKEDGIYVATLNVGLFFQSLDASLDQWAYVYVRKNGAAILQHGFRLQLITSLAYRIFHGGISEPFQFSANDVITATFSETTSGSSYIIVAPATLSVMKP